MVKSCSEFLIQYNEFSNIIQEYLSTYNFIVSQNKSREDSDRMSLLRELQIIENDERQQMVQLQNRIQNYLGSLRRLLYTVEQNERLITEKRFLKLKSRHVDSQQNTEEHYKQEEINKQVSEVIKEIQKITQSKMPKSLASICSFFNPNFRKSTYQRIVENRLELEHMIAAAENDVRIVSAELQQDISSSTREKVSQLQQKMEQLSVTRTADNDNAMMQLKNLLLNGLEKIFCTDTEYSKAYEQLKDYISTYTTDEISDMEDFEKLFIGFVNQNMNVEDDGTVDSFLKTILPNGIYTEQNLLLPIVLNKYFEKPICVNYYSEYNSQLYPLFSNYASQMMNLFTNVGVSTHLVDCTNMGGKYAEFSSYESNDENKRVNIVRTSDELKKLLEELSNYIIETNSLYLKNSFQNIDEYNRESAIKRDIHVLFISNISEIPSGEMLDKLSSIIRNGNRCGVFVFLGVSTDECQVSGLISQFRVNEINTLIELCDTIHMSSDGTLSFGNGTPGFTAPPDINSNMVQKIIENCIKKQGTLTIVPLMDHILSEEQFFSQKCYENIFIPIGVDAQGNEYSLDLNKEAAYMLVGGNPSCGKSSLIHTIILQCITRYSPEDLILYVADLKDGSEFDTYIHKGIKSVKVVLDDSESDISASFLNFIKSNVEERLEKFGVLSQESGEIVRNIEQFYNVNNEQKLVENIPRMLVIIDEFQSLYNSSRVTGEITNWLVRMCRTVGIYIIMASQRAQGDSTSVANSFGNQTKEYFIYRAMFKLPYSGAREIMSENCSDTNRENSAMRKAQTLKNGQIIINSNMGATEEDNKIVQCYYPNNDTISAICRTVIEKQGTQKGIILNSEATVCFEPDLFYETRYYVLGESNRLFYDTCNRNTDVFIDDNLISFNAENSNKLISCGTDTRVMGSSFWAILCRMISTNSNNLCVCILSMHNVLDWLQIPQAINDKFFITESADEFINYIQSCRSKGQKVYSVILNPYLIEELQKDEFSSASETVQKILDCWDDRNIFTLILTDNMKKLKDECSYIEAAIPHRIISVGNIASIRTAMTFDAGDKLSDSPFNTIRPNVIKAYYYNKETDKLGRFRMYQIEQIIQNVNIDALASQNIANASNEWYSGLVGN